MIARREGAVFDDYQAKVLSAIEFFTAGYTVTATRGHSDPVEQLRVIEKYARADGVLLKPFAADNVYDKVFDADEGEEIYLWQPAWSALLNLYHETRGEKGKKINPPLLAKCLRDYVNSAGVNQRGKLIAPSPHIAGGRSGTWPIDFSGNILLADGSRMTSLDIVADIMHEAQLSGVAIANITKEVGNNCVHIDLKKEAGNG